jgi:dipeptidyl aminopeptidase/acylaminoacyl peptidase
MTNDERPRPLIALLAAVPEVGTEYRPFSISPDDTTVAFEWRQDGDWQIFTVDAHGTTPPKHLIAIDDPCGCPKYSADGRYLYFARDDCGSECFDFYRYELATGELENLLPDTPTLAPNPNFQLSPDSTQIALCANHGQGYSAALMPAAPCPGGVGVEFVAENHFNDWTPQWSPDGTRVAWHSDTHGQDSSVFVATVTGSDAKIIADGASPIGGGDPVLAWSPRWSPDGRRIAFTGVVGERYAIGVYDVAADRIDWAWSGDRDAHHPVWSPDGRALAFLTDHDAETALRHLDLQTQVCRDLSIGRGNHYHPRFTPDGAALIVALSGPGVPSDLFRVELADGRSTRLTNGLPDALAGHEFVGGEHIHYRSLDVLAEVPALLVRPRTHNGAGVVIIHGGPTWHHANEWDPLREAFVDAGCMVVHPNYRGSDGYGRRWQVANRFLLGQGEAQDCAGAHALLVEMGCDPGRIAVTGRSHGGYMTMQMLTQFPDLWAVGVAGVPFFDHIDAQIDPAVRDDLRWWDRENVGDMIKDRARLEYFSPINHLDRVKAPLLILAASRDPRCPTRQVGRVVDTLRAAGQECEAYIYADEGHEISGVENHIDYDRRTVEYILERIVSPPV